jgi:hypothetical protein
MSEEQNQLQSWATNEKLGLVLGSIRTTTSFIKNAIIEKHRFSWIITHYLIYLKEAKVLDLACGKEDIHLPDQLGLTYLVPISETVS